MIPFTRILTYGNTVKGLAVKEIKMALTHLSIVDNEGGLLCYGTNPNGSMGIGSTSNVVGWYDSAIDNVDRIWHNGSRCSIVRKIDGTLWFCGTYFNQQLGSPNLSTASPVTQWTEITDRVTFDPKLIIDVIPSYTFMTFLLSTGEIYTTDRGAIPGTTVVNPNGYTGWRVNQPPVKFVKIATYPWASSYTGVYIGIDEEGNAYGIGYDGWKQISSSGSGTLTSWTPTVTAYKIKDVQMGSNFNIYQTTNNRMIYCGISGVINTANINNTVYQYPVTGDNIAQRIFASTSGVYHIRSNNSMWGSYANNQMPVAPNSLGNPSQTQIRIMPEDYNSIEYLFCTTSQQMVVIYKDPTDGKRRMYVLGASLGGSNTLTTFTEIEFPARYVS